MKRKVEVGTTSERVISLTEVRDHRRHRILNWQLDIKVGVCLQAVAVNVQKALRVRLPSLLV